jgi:hypoxanthine phosphoribosyltransferase
MVDVLNVSWNEVMLMIDTLAYKFNTSQEYRGIKYLYGVPRGGLIPAVLLSHKLNLPLVTRMGDASRQKHTLIVDDIVDSGRTASLIATKMPMFSLLQREDSIYFADAYHTLIKQGIWVVFPWENPEASHKQDYLK